MVKGIAKKLMTGCALAVLMGVSGNAFANWTEIGDAGQLPGTAQVVVGGGPLATITGTYSIWDADMYQIYISDPAGFSAHAYRTPGTGLLLDPQLFLFDASGMGVYANNNRSFGERAALLPSGHAYSPTSAGLYYLAISGSNLDPYSGGDRIFSNMPWNQVHGPNAGVGAINGWDTFTVMGGAYTIDLTGVAYHVPTPDAILLASIGVCLVGWLRRLRTL